jgi:ATP-dependent exoDNAse (exonuclease V) alpha subunit
VQELAARHPESSPDTLTMAIFHLHIKSISRGAGRSAPAAAAYRAGERIRDERTGVLHNHSHRTDVSHKEILLPSSLQGADYAWATDRASLWNAAERAEVRHDARVAREYQVTLPFELSAEERLRLARSLAQELAERHNVAIDLAVHAPPAAGDPRNHHAHLLATSREVTASGFGGKAGLDMAGSERQRRGLPVGIAEIKAVRERWATLSNQAFEAAGLQVRIDHRSLRAQGIDREPRPYIPAQAFYMERRGLHSEVAERIRERYRARVAARLARAAGQTAAQPSAPGIDLEQVRRQAREAWLELRGREPDGSTAAQNEAHIKESSGAGQAAPKHQPHSVAAMEREAADQDLGL